MANGWLTVLMNVLTVLTYVLTMLTDVLTIVVTNVLTCTLPWPVSSVVSTLY